MQGSGTCVQTLVTKVTQTEIITAKADTNGREILREVDQAPLKKLDPLVPTETEIISQTLFPCTREFSHKGENVTTRVVLKGGGISDCRSKNFLMWLSLMLPHKNLHLRRIDDVETLTYL